MKKWANSLEPSYKSLVLFALVKKEAGADNFEKIYVPMKLTVLNVDNDMTEEELTAEMQKRGVSAVLYKEWSLGDLANNGQVSLQLGQSIRNTIFYNQVSGELPINDATVYVAILDDTIAEQVKEHTLLKVAGSAYYPGSVPVVTIPVMVFFTAAAAAQGKYDLALLPATLVGGLIAYLFYNWHPAKVFMGDTGSLFLGGVICAMSFALNMPLILILVGFVYIVETVSVILQVGYFKLTHGKRLFKMSPIHHHFEMCGWKEEKIVLTFAAVSALMCLLAWFGISGRI